MEFNGQGAADFAKQKRSICGQGSQPVPTGKKPILPEGSKKNSF